MTTFRFVAIPVLLSAGLCLASPEPPRLAPRSTLPARADSVPKDWSAGIAADGALSLSHPAASRGGVVLRPPTNTWDLSAFGYARVNLVNRGTGLVWIVGRLDNEGAEDWWNSTSGEAFLRPGETGTLGFAFPRPESAYDGPAIFKGMSGKPNGHRTHWKAFDAGRVTQLRLAIESSAPGIRLENIRLSAAWPYGSAANRDAETLPFLDRFGQVRAADWPGKLAREDELADRAAREKTALDTAATGLPFDRYGGWAAGPQREATGRFRVEKVDGRWWFVDPDGRLFWSQGVASVGFSAGTPVKNRAALFAWLPKPGDDLYETGLGGRQPGGRADFLAMNLRRTFGADWRPAAVDRTHRRMRAWGLNTLGAWTDESLLDAPRTPYTAMLHVWHRAVAGVDHLPDPFDTNFPARVRKALADWKAKRGEDPWCIGVFIDNEVDWVNDLPERVFAAPSNQPARIAFAAMLEKRHGAIERLNAEWGTNAKTWADLFAAPPKRDGRNAKDYDALIETFAEAYYRTCREAMRDVLPHHLYLGSRIHRCPPAVAAVAARRVDVYSINQYGALASTGTLPGDADVPALVAEYHFGALDRGPLGASLFPVHDQVQRGRAFAAYVVAGLRHPRLVGAHWFAWADQSAAGRPGENYQIGFVDVTDTPYPEMTAMARRLAARLYDIRAAPGGGVLEHLERLFAPF